MIEEPSWLTRIKKILFARFHFFGSVSTSLEMVAMLEDDPMSDVIRTAATDGRMVLFNRKFMESISSESQVFVACHEIMHCILMSTARRYGRDPTMWNIASDHAINLLLKESKILVPDAKIPGGLKHASGHPVVICLDHKYEGKSAEEIYDELLTLNGRCGGSCLDEHPEIRTKYAIGDDDRVTVGEMTQQQRSVIERSIKSAVSRGMMAGDMSIGMRRIVGELCEPKLDWKTILASEITKLAGSGDYSFSPPDPLFFSGGMTLPVLALEEHVRVSIVIDASGSMSPRDINVVMSETKGLTSQYAGWEIQVMSFDSVLYEPVIYDDSDGDAIFSHRIDGGGGTCFGPPLEYIAGQKNPFGGKELVLFFTDGFTGDGWHEHLSHLNVLWLLNNRNSPPWGKAVRYDSYV